MVVPGCYGARGVHGNGEPRMQFVRGWKWAALFYTAMTDVDIVSHALPEHGFAVQSVKLGYRAKNPVSLSDTERDEVEAFLDAMDADDDVQHVYVGLA